ncbi:MAG: RsmE family RNA methyltransferase, partial [Bacteroidota bacterium]|nr:RsmE family RNA methyltransferase [Bacteroidota bacterium]
STWPALSNTNEIIAIIGPEGGFTKDEANLASDNGFSWVSLGPNRLRAESASLAIVQQINVFSKLS